MALSTWLRYIGTKPPGSGERNSRSKAYSKTQEKQFVICVDNDGYAASLERRKIYIALRDAEATKHGMLRIVDESGDDYLYPKAFFLSIALPEAAKKAVLDAA